MIAELYSWADKLQSGLELAYQCHEKDSHSIPKKVHKIAFFGMGGSGIAGRMVKTIIEKRSSLPVYVIDYPEVPLMVDKDTLAFVVSYSGNTWETVNALEILLSRGIPTIVISRGGKALEIAQRTALAYVRVPETSAPRGALGYFLGFILGFLDLKGYFANGRLVVNQWIEHIKNLLPVYKNETFFEEFLTYAQAVSFFHVLGISGDSDACAFRAQTQFNENSKMPVVTSQLPEANHNLIVGFSPRQHSFIVLANTNFLKQELFQALEATHEVLIEQGCALYKIPVFGDTWEQQLISLILWSDFASLYLGQRRGVQIVETPQIDSLKEKIRRKGLRK